MHVEPAANIWTNIQIPFDVLRAAIPFKEGDILYETDAEGAGGLFHLKVSLIGPLRLGAEAGQLALCARVRAEVSPPRRGALSWLKALGSATQWELDYEVALMAELRVIEGWKLACQIRHRLTPQTAGKGLHIASANAFAQPAAEKVLQEVAQHLAQSVSAFPLADLAQAAWRELHQHWETEGDPALHISLGSILPPVLCAALLADQGGLSSWLGIRATPAMSDTPLPLPMVPQLPPPLPGWPDSGESNCPLHMRLSWQLLSRPLLERRPDRGVYPMLETADWEYISPRKASLAFTGQFQRAGQRLPGSQFKGEVLVELNNALHPVKLEAFHSLRGGWLGRLLLRLGQRSVQREAGRQAAEALETLRQQLIDEINNNLSALPVGEGHLLHVQLRDIAPEALSFYEGGLHLAWRLRGRVALVLRTLPAAETAQGAMPR